MAKKVCEHCGASMVEYKHGLSEGLVTGLIRIAKIEKPINIKELRLTRNQWDNFQKLRYWDLVVQANGGKLKGGVWAITMKGLDFVKGKISVPKSVWTYRGGFLRYDGEEVRIHVIVNGYKFQDDYYNESKPHPGSDPSPDPAF